MSYDYENSITLSHDLNEEVSLEMWPSTVVIIPRTGT